MVTIPAHCGQTAVCGRCGAVYWRSAGHSCRRRCTGHARHSSPSALDRGLVEAGCVASDAKAAADLALTRIAFLTAHLEDLIAEDKAAQPQVAPSPRHLRLVREQNLMGSA